MFEVHFPFQKNSSFIKLQIWVKAITIETIKQGSPHGQFRPENSKVEFLGRNCWEAAQRCTNQPGVVCHGALLHIVNHTSSEHEFHQNTIFETSEILFLFSDGKSVKTQSHLVV